MNIFQNLIDKPENIEIPPDDENDSQDYQATFHLESELKKEQIREKKIKNEKSINNLVERTMAQAMIEAVGQEIQTAFVDFSRRESPVIAAMLGIPHLERDLENILSKKIQVSIDAVKATCVKLARDGMFE